MKSRIIALLIVVLLGNTPGFAQLINGSFEDEFGTFSMEGWQNFGGIASSDTPEEGGFWSLGLYGGCIWAYCEQPVPAIMDGQIWQLSCWAKVADLFSGGTASFSYPYTGIFFIDTVWTQYSVTDTFYLTGNDTVSVKLEGGGGFAGGGGVLIDLVDLTYLGSITTSGFENKPERDDFSIQIFPNPVKDIVSISLLVSNPSTISFTLFNSIGQRIKVVTSDNLEPGRFSIPISISAFPKGIYFIECTIDDLIEPRNSKAVRRPILKL